jgi:hypothetical protein
MEYIIVDSNNNWLSTDTNKKRAIGQFNEMKEHCKNDEEYEGMELGEEIYLYEAKEIKSFKL